MDIVDIQSSIKCGMHGGREGDDSDLKGSIPVQSNKLQRAKDIMMMQMKEQLLASTHIEAYKQY